MDMDDYEDHAEERGGEQDETMEEGEDESGPSRAGDATAHAMIQDKGRKRKRRTWKMCLDRLLVQPHRKHTIGGLLKLRRLWAQPRQEWSLSIDSSQMM